MDLKRKAQRMFIQMKSSTQTRNIKEDIEYTFDLEFDEFYEWLCENNYEWFHLAWSLSDYDKKLAPSVDRDNDFKSYTFDNMKLGTWDDNNCKPKPKRFKVVTQYDMKGNLVCEYESVKEAKSKTNINHISAVCRFERKQAGGYIWRYDNV